MSWRIKKGARRLSLERTHTLEKGEMLIDGMEIEE